MRLFYVFVLTFFFLAGQAQNSFKLEDKWAWSAETSVFSLSDLPGQHTSRGFTAEWFLGKRWSLRGGISAGPGFVKFTTEPFALWLLKEGINSDDWSRYRPNRYRSTRSASPGKAALVLLLVLLDSDALCYNIPVNKELYISVFGSPVQTTFSFSNSRTYMYSLVGAGLKYVSKTGLTANASIEYDEGFFFRSGRGIRANFSIGYLFR